LQLDAMTETCALDVADRGGVSMATIGKLFGVTREDVRQYQNRGLEKVGPDLADFSDLETGKGETNEFGTVAPCNEIDLAT